MTAKFRLGKKFTPSGERTVRIRKVARSIRVISTKKKLTDFILKSVSFFLVFRIIRINKINPAINSAEHQMKNIGDAKRFFIYNHHLAIVPQELFKIV